MAADPRPFSSNQTYQTEGWQVLPFNPPSFDRRVRWWVGASPLAGPARRLVWRYRRVRSTIPDLTNRIDPDREHDAWLRRHLIDVAVYPAPLRQAILAKTKSLVAVHDVQHLSNAHFPELPRTERDSRERLFRGICSYSDGILVDSEIGKEDVLAAYGRFGLSPERVFVLPFVVPPQVEGPSSAEVIREVRARFRLPPRYVLFPAAFWPHKNHLRFTEAAIQVMGSCDDLYVVFTGTSEGALRSDTRMAVEELASRKRLAGRFRYLGFVEPEDMRALYAGSSVVALPTFFGPTNIPVIEAWAHSVPVLTSDIRGIREQCEGAAILVQPQSVDSIVDGLTRLWVCESTRRRVIQRGREKVHAYGVGHFRDRLWSIIDTIAARPKRPATIGPPTSAPVR